MVANKIEESFFFCSVREQVHALHNTNNGIRLEEGTTTQLLRACTET